MSTTEERITPLADQAAAAEGCTLVDVALAQDGHAPVLRVLVERIQDDGIPGDTGGEDGPGPGGLTLADCAAISERLSALLDLHDPLSGGYRLEVSSPGLNRPLKKAADFVRFTGRQAVIRTLRPVGAPVGGNEADGMESSIVSGRKTFRGALAGMDGEAVVITVQDVVYRIPLSVIGKANLEHEFPVSRRPASQKFKRGGGHT